MNKNDEAFVRLLNLAHEMYPLLWTVLDEAERRGDAECVVAAFDAHGLLLRIHRALTLWHLEDIQGSQESSEKGVGAEPLDISS